MRKTATVAPEPTSPSTPPEGDAMARVLALLQDQTKRFDELEAANAELREELRATKARTSSFVPKEATQRRKGGVFAGLNEAIGGPGKRGWGEKWAEGVSSSILVDIHGEKIPEMLLSRLAPQFQEGDAVRVNPDSVRAGFPEGQTWGDVLARIGCEGYGTVKKIYWLNDDGHWKYSVVVPGLTGARPDGFLDDELLPA